MLFVYLRKKKSYFLYNLHIYQIFCYTIFNILNFTGGPADRIDNTTEAVYNNMMPFSLNPIMYNLLHGSHRWDMLTTIK